MSPLDLFELPADASERAVKSAYARLLKQARPDEDPQAFQSLQENYKAALAYLKWRDAGEVGLSLAQPIQPVLHPANDVTLKPRAQDGSPPMEEEKSTPPVVASNADVSPGSFYDELVAMVASADAQTLREWLGRQSLDWLFNEKAMLGEQVVSMVEQQPDRVSIAQFEVLADFFEFDDVLRGFDPMRIAALRHLTQEHEARKPRQAWVAALFAPGNEQALVEHLRWIGDPGIYIAPLVPWFARQLTGSASLKVARRLSWIPHMAPMMMRFMRSIDGGRLDALSPTIPVDTVVYWLRSETTFRRWETLRGLFYVMIAMFVVLKLMVAFSSR